MIIILWLIFSFIVAAIGESRSIGFWGALFLSILLSPLIGLIVVLCSERNSDIAHKRKMEELAKTQIRAQAGTLTDEEKIKLFDEMTQKAKHEKDEFAKYKKL